MAEAQPEEPPPTEANALNAEPQQEPKKQSNAGAQTSLGNPSELSAPGEHPLQTPWCFWYDKKTPRRNSDAEQYKASLHKVGGFSTVQGFWRHYVHLKRPSVLENNVNLYLFREGPNMLPSWEAFPDGGCWILKIRKKGQSSGASVLGKMWQDLVFAAVGECFEEPTVVGIGMAIRSKEDLLSVWNSDNTNDQVRFSIGEKLKAILDLEPSTMIEYKHHNQSLRDMSTFRNAKPYVFAAAQKATD